MTDELSSLLSKKKGDSLNQEEFNLLASIKEYDISLMESDEECDFDTLYAYCVLVENGLIDYNDDKEQLFFSLIDKFYWDLQTDDLFFVYHNLLPYIDKMMDEFDPGFLNFMSECYLAGVNGYSDDKKAFMYAEAAANYQMSGMIGGFSLVNTLMQINNAYLSLAKMYMEGIGTEKDYPRAFNYLVCYRRDHLLQKHMYDSLGDLFYQLFKLMDEQSKAGINYPGLHYCLARMYREGMGTEYNYKMYLKCVELEKKNYKNSEMDDTEYLERLESYSEREINLLNHTEPVKIYKGSLENVKKGQYISLGSYDHRAIIWKVLAVEDGKALLLASECLESSYVAKKHGNDIGDCYENSYLKRFVRSMAFDTFSDINETIYYDDVFVPNENGDYFFLLSLEDVKKYLRIKKSRFCASRIQAKFNGYDDCGVEYNDYMDSAPWWISTEIGNGLGYIDEYGEICSANPNFECTGIRPAAWVNLSYK